MAFENQHFDSRMLTYQTMVNLPLQYAQLSMYEDLEDIGNQKYVCTALTNLGAVLLSTRAAQDIFSWIHGLQSAQKDTTYIVSPFTEYIYDHTNASLKNVHPANRQNTRDSVKNIMETAPKYSAAYMNTNVFAFVCSAALGAAVANRKLKMSPIQALAYGLSQPTSVILRDLSQ